MVDLIMLKKILCLTLGLSSINALANVRCGNLNHADIKDNYTGVCELNYLETFYEGEAVSIDAPEGTQFGNIKARYDIRCLLPQANGDEVSGVYRQLAVEMTQDYDIATKTIKTNIPGIYMRGNGQPLGGNAGHMILSILAAEKVGGGGDGVGKVRGQPIIIDRQPFYCAHDAQTKTIVSIHRGKEPIEAGEYSVTALHAAQIVLGQTSGAGTPTDFIKYLDPAVVTLGNATCRLRQEGDITVAVNNGAAMSPAEFERIATPFSVPLVCSSVAMPVKYTLTANSAGAHLAEGIFDINKTSDSASGMAYKISHMKDGVIVKAVDLKSKQTDEKGPDTTDHELSFSVSPVKIAETVTSGRADATLTLELDYQ